MQDDVLASLVAVCTFAGRPLVEVNVLDNALGQKGLTRACPCLHATPRSNALSSGSSSATTASRRWRPSSSSACCSSAIAPPRRAATSRPTATTPPSPRVRARRTHQPAALPLLQQHEWRRWRAHACAAAPALLAARHPALLGHTCRARRLGRVCARRGRRAQRRATSAMHGSLLQALSPSRSAPPPRFACSRPHLRWRS